MIKTVVSLKKVIKGKITMYCCTNLKTAMDGGHIILSDDGYLYAGSTWNSNLKLEFCPYCGSEITYEEVE